MKLYFGLMSLLSVASVVNCTASYAADDQIVLEQKSQLLGRELTVRQQYGTTAEGAGAETTTHVKFIGNPKPLLDANVQYLGDGLPQLPTDGKDPLGDIINNVKHDYYVRGIRVWSDDMGYKEGSFYYSGGVAPTHIPIPILTYPVGPMILELDAGVEFEAMLEAKLTPAISIPVEDSSLTASLKAEAYAAGFVEGAARIVVLRAGVGGLVNVIEGDASVAAKIFFKKAPPQLTYGGKVAVLSGRIYAFVDTNIFFGKWKKLLSYDLYAWKGKCWAFGGEVCKTK